MQFTIALFFVAIFDYAQVCRCARSNTMDSYDAFRVFYRGNHTNDLVDFSVRSALYHKAVAEVKAHNAKGSSWVAAVNEFADWTDEERSKLFGYRRLGPRKQASESVSSFLETSPGRKVRAESVDWQHLKTTGFVKSQGGCGSCWAVSSGGALEMYLELATGLSQQLSYDQIVDCTPNKHQCGGSGGCGGATAELAFEYVKTHGLALAAGPGANVYFSDAGENMQGTCHDNKVKPYITIKDHITLPVNKMEPLMDAVAHGPVVISLDATSWSFYHSGIHDSCAKDAIVNHAVLFIGYGMDSETGEKYWKIRNSWGQGWGEDGAIRLPRSDQDEEHCGVDNDPHKGVACDYDTAPQVEVCGPCGMFYDSAYPVGVELASSSA